MSHTTAIPGRTDGLAPAAGMLGETKSGSGTRGFTSNTSANTGWALSSAVTECPINTGVWLVSWHISISVTSGTTNGDRVAVLTTDTTDGWGPTVNLDSRNLNFLTSTSPVGLESRAMTSIVIVPAGTTYNLRGKVFATTHTTFTGSYTFNVQAVRIA